MAPEQLDETTDGTDLRGPLAAAALGGLAGALVGAARVLAGRESQDEDDELDEQPDDEVQGDEPQDEADVSGEREPEADESEEPEAEGEEEPEADAGEEPESADGDGDVPGDLRRVVSRASEQLAALTGRPTESVLGVERTDDGWLVRLEAVELSRIPSSTDVLGAYEVEVDGDGELRRYGRLDRYVRSRGGGAA